MKSNLKKLIAAGAIATQVGACATNDFSQGALNSVNRANAVTESIGYPPFQIIDQTNENCMNTSAFNALIFAFEDVAYDEACADAMLKKAALANPTIKGKNRVLASKIARDDIPYLAPTVVDGKFSDKFGLYIGGLLGGNIITDNETALREHAARVTLAQPHVRGFEQATAYAMYAERNEETKARMLRAAWEASVVTRAENRRFVNENIQEMRVGKKVRVSLGSESATAERKTAQTVCERTPENPNIMRCKEVVVTAQQLQELRAQPNIMLGLN